MNALAPASTFTAPASDSIRLRVLSLGVGVQSTTLALMAAHGEVGPMPDCAIFADTGWEPSAVYEHLAWLRSSNVLPFPVHVVSGGDLHADLLRAGRGERWASIPAFTRTVRGVRVEIGMIRRQCTKDYKIVPIRRQVRALAGLTRRRSPKAPVVEQWIGISLDEAIRMKPSFEDWQVNRWPLIEQRMSRRDCLRWLERHGYTIPPKSSCVGCPFHSDDVWRTLRDEDATAWTQAVEVDRAIRVGLRGVRGEVFLHRSAVPLDEADLSTPATPDNSTSGPTSARACAACSPTPPAHLGPSSGSGAARSVVTRVRSAAGAGCPVQRRYADARSRLCGSRDHAEYIARALATEGGHLAIGHGGATLISAGAGCRAASPTRSRPRRSPPACP